MSYVSQQFLLSDCGSLANFKNWAQAISTAFSSSGWTQTTDTGQVNWSSIAAIPSNPNFVYEIWQPADPLQTGATKFFLKVNYGKSSNGTPGPRIQFQLGTGTDGAGNLTGITSFVCESVNNGAQVGNGSINTFDCYFSGDIDRIGMIMWRSGATGFAFAVERTHNTDGTNNSDGVTFASAAVQGNTNNNARGVQSLIFGIGAANMSGGGNPFSGQAYYPIVWDGINASAAINNSVPVTPVFPIYGKVGNPMTVIAFVHSQDVAEACTFSTTLYGATRTYIGSGNFSIQWPPNGTQCRFCIRYD